MRLPFLTVREALEAVLTVHTSQSATGEFRLRENVRPTDLDPEGRRRYEAAWRTLAEARRRSAF
jgi:hypothetical protein